MTAKGPGCVETVNTVVGKARNKAFVEFGDFGVTTHQEALQGVCGLLQLDQGN